MVTAFVGHAGAHAACGRRARGGVHEVCGVRAESWSARRNCPHLDAHRFGHFLSTVQRFSTCLSAAASDESSDDLKTKDPVPAVKPPPPRPVPAGEKAAQPKALELGVADELEEAEESLLRRPRDPSELRTESENRRHRPVAPVRRRRRRLRLRSDELDWDNMESVPLVKRQADPESGEDYWIAPEKGAGSDELVVQTKRKKKRAPRKPVDENVKVKLMKETVQPYKNNWIGVVVVIVLALVFLYNVLPNEAPRIAIPDL